MPALFLARLRRTFETRRAPSLLFGLVLPVVPWLGVPAPTGMVLPTAENAAEVPSVAAGAQLVAGARSISSNLANKGIKALDLRWDLDGGAVSYLSGRDLAMPSPAAPGTATVSARVLAWLTGQGSAFGVGQNHSGNMLLDAFIANVNAAGDASAHGPVGGFASALSQSWAFVRLPSVGTEPVMPDYGNAPVENYGPVVAYRVGWR